MPAGHRLAFDAPSQAGGSGDTLPDVVSTLGRRTRPGGCDDDLAAAGPSTSASSGSPTMRAWR
jgi:hypothetical protein